MKQLPTAISAHCTKNLQYLHQMNTTSLLQTLSRADDAGHELPCY
ncbi:hypothetical protein SynBIOSU31_00653 [Synechococcus sp. BIOS-U3-1]|nr:hypothetical protein SynBIOSU31_00653 [Synechococcus sp. BIOS-U3-1]